MKARMKMKNRSHRFDINITKPRYGYEYPKCKMCLGMMMVMCNKQHLSNIEAEFMKKLSNTSTQ